ncbi:MAG: MBL fold metallo-hydrolase, partial [Burkholderiales bacterium]|nr:MBL fold metallo-hydrolase [Burkholderiales bacterium]
MAQRERHTVLIDTGCGNDKSRALPLFQRFHQLHLPYLDHLRAEGVAPEDVDLVICTHLHVDHVGWNKRIKKGCWVPTFPNARYIFSRREFEHWQSPAGAAVMPENMAVIADSVIPVVEAGLVEFIDDGSSIIDGLVFHDAFGHTAGHGMLKLESGRDAAVFPGDSLHQPMQVFRPDWNSC